MKEFARGLWIPDEIVADRRLTAGQKMILAMLRRQKKTHKVRQEDIATHIGMTMRCVQHAYRKFKELGLLENGRNTD